MCSRHPKNCANDPRDAAWVSYDGFVDKGVTRMLHRNLHESQMGLTILYRNQASVLEQIAAEQAPAHETRRLAAMWAILNLVRRGDLSAANTWSDRLIGGTVPSDVASSVKRYTNDSDMFCAIELWKKTI